MYEGMNGVKIRNALTKETNPDTLRIFARDKRSIVAAKAQLRLRQLGLVLGDGQLDNTGTYEGPLDENGLAPVEPNLDDIIAEKIYELSDGPAPEPPPKPEAERKRTARRRNLPPADKLDPNVPVLDQLASVLGKDGAEAVIANGIEAARAPLPSPPVDSPEPQPKLKGRSKFTTRQLAKLVETWGKTRVCPKCGKRKDLVDGFGFRRMEGGKVRPQPQCKRCRREASKRSKTEPVRETTRQALEQKRQAQAERKAQREADHAAKEAT